MVMMTASAWCWATVRKGFSVRQSMKRLVMNLKKKQSGAAMAEYGLLLLLIALVVAAVTLYLGEQIQSSYHKTVLCIQAAYADNATVETVGAACSPFQSSGS